MAEYVYTLHNVRKAHGDKVVLDNVTLSFLPDAKIGVVGPNGTGKSTLLKIMAGLEQANNGEAMLAPEATVGMLQQEPPLSEGQTVLGERRGGRRRRSRASSTATTRSARPWPTPMPTTTRCSPRWATCRTDLDHANAWDLDSRLDQAMDALRCPPPRRDRGQPLRWRAPPGRAVQAAAPAARLLLLDEPTNHLDAESVQWLESHLAAYPGAVLAVTHDRYFLDNVADLDPRARPGSRHPYEGNYSTYLETKKERLKIEGEKDAKRAKMLERELEWVRSNAKARQTKSGAAGALRGDGGRGRPDAQDRHLRDQHPAGPAAGRRRARGRPPDQGVRRPCPDRGPVLHAAPRRHRRRHRPQRRRQDDAVPDDRRGGEARRRAARRRQDGRRSPTSTRAAAASTRRRTSGRSSPTASTTSRSPTSR